MNLDDIKLKIINSFNEGNNSHAFLFVTNNIEETYQAIKQIIIKVNCNSNEDNCNCNICNTIKKETNPDVIIINPEGKEIKKDDVLNLIYRFQSKPLINKMSTYIIRNAERLSTVSANKLLKFLEEPEGNIVGFYITDNINSVLPTIKSRCSIYNIKYNANNLLDLLNINEDIFSKYYDNALELLINLNNSFHYELMKDSKKYSKKERIDIEYILKIIKEIYTIKFEYLTTNKFDDVEYVKNIIKNIETNDINTIVKRIDLLDNIINDFKFNVNKDLFINKLFICWE